MCVCVNPPPDREEIKEEQQIGPQIRQFNIEGRYYNCNGFAVAIVASVTEPIDWAAYIGADDGSHSKRETVSFTADHGEKLPEEDARHYFPELKEMPYRY